MPNIDSAKQWFQTGDFPTQAQFYQVFEWLRWKDEQISVGDIAGLTALVQGKADQAALNALADAINREALLQSNDFTFSLMANKRLQTIIIIPSADYTLKIGLTDGGEEVMVATPLIQDEVFILDCAVYAVNNLPIYFRGITAQTQIFIYKR